MEHITLVQFLQYIIYKNNRIMKKSYSFILVLILMAGLLCSCHINKVSGDGNVVSKEIPIKDYDEYKSREKTSTSNICNRMTFPI